MGKLDGARGAALAVLAAVAGTASVGIAALARAGLCLHQLGLFGRQPAPMAGMDMGGMTMDTATAAPCPILMGAAAFAAALCLAALVAVVVQRRRASEVAVASARLVLGLRFAPTTGLLTAVGAIPLTAMLVLDGATSGIAPYVAGLALLGCALACAATLIAVAKLILAFARRFVIALLAAPRWLLPGSDAPWLSRAAFVPISAGTRLVRRRPSRAPPR